MIPDPRLQVEPAPDAQDSGVEPPPEPASAGVTPGPGDERPEPAWAEGDAATHLEELIVEETAAPLVTTAADGVAIELVGPHLRVSGRVNIGYHRRLSDFVNNHDGLIELTGAMVLRRNGDPTRVTAPHMWINPDDVTLIGAVVDEPARSSNGEQIQMMLKVAHPLIVVTPGHTLTGEVHLNREALLSVFIESSDPRFLPVTDVRTRSLADRRVITRYAFALLNRRHIVAATALQPGMIRGRSVL